MSILSDMIRKLNLLLAGQQRLMDDHKRLLISDEATREQIGEVKAQLNRIEKQQKDDGVVLRHIEEILTEEDDLPDAPLPIMVWRALAERKENDMTVIDYEADLPPIDFTNPKNVDVVIQRIAVIENGVEKSTKDETKDATVTTFTVLKGATVRLTRQLVDDETPPNVGKVTASQEFVAADTISPDAPGDFGEIRAVAEREVPDA